tara:strand:+ start:1745 stop:2863 length:1119 start_codon:yes stop_codon:yes gene_type:complete
MTEVDHGSRDHAEFSPSSLKYVAACAGYEGKDGTSAAAEMGTRIHEALEVRDPSALHNEEEVSIYDQIVEMEADFMGNFGVVEEEHNEIQVDVKLDGTETWGTCDRFLVLEEGKAVMADYKTGISIIDPPESNWQAKAYVVGAFQQFENIEEIVFVFYVPKHTACLHYTFHRGDVEGLVKDLSDVIKKGEQIRPKWDRGSPELEDCTPTQYCRFCKHEDACPALGGLVLDVAKKIDSTIPDVDLENIDDPARLSELFNIAKIVENWAKRIKERTVEAAKDGVELDGLRLRSMGRTRKIVDNATLVKIAADHGLDEDTVLESVTISLSKVAKLVASQAESGSKKEKESNFVDACEDAGIIQTSAERFTVVNQG